MGVRFQQGEVTLQVDVCFQAQATFTLRNKWLRGHFQ